MFVEVKTRDGARFGTGAEAVTWVKRRRLAGVALDYLVRHHAVNHPCRFDVVSVQVGDCGADIEVIRNAFDLTE